LFSVLLIVVRPFTFGHCFVCTFFDLRKGPGGSMSQLVGLPNNSYKPMTNTAWVRAWLCKLQKGCTRLTPASDKVRRWFSPGTPASSTTKTGRHDINLMHNQSIYGFYLPLWYLQTFLMTSFIPRTMHVQISKLGIFFYLNAMV
jgi:hypothetical protein